MTKELKQKADNYYFKKYTRTLDIGEEERQKAITEAYIAGATQNGIQWHKIFIDSNPNPCEYWELPQENLPKNQNFYFVKLKNGFIKICELKYDCWDRKKYFYNLNGGKQSNVAEWLDYPTV